MNILLPLEGDMGGVVLLILLIMFGPAILMGIIGAILIGKQKKKSGKVLLILAGVYLLISLGVCGAMMGGFY